MITQGICIKKQKTHSISMGIKESKTTMQMLSLFLAIFLTLSVSILLDFRGEDDSSNKERNEKIQNEIEPLESLNKDHEYKENEELEEHEGKDNE